MQHRPVFGDVDRFTREHRRPAGFHAGDACDREEGGEHLVVDSVLGVVDAQVADVDHVTLGAAGVAAEQLGQRTRDRVTDECLPLRRGGDVDGADRGRASTRR